MLGTLRAASGYRIPDRDSLEDIPEEDRAVALERQEEERQSDFISANAPQNSPVNPGVLEQMKNYLWLLGFRPAGQQDVLLLDDVRGNPDEWVLEEIAERFTYPGVRSF